MRSSEFGSERARAIRPARASPERYPPVMTDTIRRKVSAELQSQGVTPGELAERVGISRQRVDEMLAGDRDRLPETWERTLGVLGFELGLLPKADERARAAVPVFTPDNEPYLGRRTVYVLDTLISSTLELNRRVAAFSHRSTLSSIQEAAAQIVPQGFNLALSIRELVRQGHLFSASVLLRPLMERAALVSYLWRKPEELALWEAGWPYNKRPGPVDLVTAMAPEKGREQAKQVSNYLSHLVHGDPIGAEYNLVPLGDGALGYGVGRVTDHPELCDFVCDQAISWLSVLNGVTAAVFPEARGA